MGISDALLVQCIRINVQVSALSNVVQIVRTNLPEEYRPLDPEVEEPLQFSVSIEADAIDETNVDTTPQKRKGTFNDTAEHAALQLSLRYARMT